MEEADLQIGGAARKSCSELIDFQREQILRDLQITVDRYNEAFRYLSLLIDDLKILRQENFALKEENVQLSLLFEEKQKSVLEIGGIGEGAIEDENEELIEELSGKSEVIQTFQVGEAEGVEIAVEVFNQGTAKTELCNKWEEMGWCPYADQCQFAHGVDELRPIIRHPRYKTQLCRMVTGPGGCPYGHRCHFRHAQSPTDSQ